MTSHWKNRLSSLGSLLLFLFLFSTEASASAGAWTARGLQGKASGSLVDISVDNNGATRLLMFDAAGRLVLGSVGPYGQPVFSQPYGPYPGWTPRASADGQDGLTRILWTHDDGSASLWLAEGLVARGAFRYERVGELTATDVAAGPGSDTHILWTGLDGTVVFQTIGSSGEIANAQSFGPYAGWNAVAIADGPDGLTRLLWRKIDGSAGLSVVSSAGILTTFRYQLPEDRTAVDLAVGADGLTQILVALDDGRMSLWIPYETGQVERYGPICNTPPGLTARRLAVGEAGSAGILFSDAEGDAVLLFLSHGGICEGAVSLAPPAPPANNIAGTWTGTYDGISPTCHSSAEATFQQAGSNVNGTMTVPCLVGQFGFIGTFGANTFQGTAFWGDPEFFPLNGTLSGSSLEMTIFDDSDSGGKPMGQLHLRRQ
jgi:hypothetical protein